MNSIMTGYYPTFEMYQAMRNQLMEILTDADLDYTPGGTNPSLGALCRELGEVEHAYIQSFKTFTLDFSYRIFSDANSTGTIIRASRLAFTGFSNDVDYLDGWHRGDSSADRGPKRRRR